MFVDNSLTATSGDARTRVAIWLAILAGTMMAIGVIKGCGVSDEIAKSLFTAFSTTKESGMGMGLSISRAIVIAHGGHLDFYNNDSGGATFFFTLSAANQKDWHG